MYDLWQVTIPDEIRGLHMELWKIEKISIEDMNSMKIDTATRNLNFLSLKVLNPVNIQTPL